MDGNPQAGDADGLWAAPRTVADVGAFVADVRRATGLTQAELAQRSGVARRFVNELETGHSTLFAERLVAVLRGLGIAVRLDAGPGASTVVLAGHSRQSTQARVDAVPPVKDLGW